MGKSFPMASAFRQAQGIFRAIRGNSTLIEAKKADLAALTAKYIDAATGGIQVESATVNGQSFSGKATSTPARAFEVLQILMSMIDRDSAGTEQPEPHFYDTRPIRKRCTSYFNRRPSRHANLGGGDRPSESRNLRDLHKVVTKYDRKTLSIRIEDAVSQLAAHGWRVQSDRDLRSRKRMAAYLQRQGQGVRRRGKYWLKDEWYPICNIDGDIADFQSDMFVDSVSLDRDGEVFEYFTKSKNGYPQIQQIPSHRISSGGLADGIQRDGKYKGYDLYDGIVYFPNTSIPVAYSLCDIDGRHKQFIEKKFILHVFDRYWPEQRRGLPLFWHSLNNLRDIMQSEEWERMNLLSMSSLNYTVENESGGPDMEEPGYEPATECGQLAVEFLQGGRIMYAKAGSGEKITQHQNFRPGNPWHEFYDMQARQCLVGACLPATLWKPSGQGTAQREDIGKACRFVEDRQSTLRKSPSGELPRRLHGRWKTTASRSLATGGTGHLPNRRNLRLMMAAA
jgi:hypothetical protein